MSEGTLVSGSDVPLLACALDMAFGTLLLSNLYFHLGDPWIAMGRETLWINLG